LLWSSQDKMTLIFPSMEPDVRPTDLTKKESMAAWILALRTDLLLVFLSLNLKRCEIKIKEERQIFVNHKLRKHVQLFLFFDTLFPSVPCYLPV